MMLSRIADSLFWMARYMERAEDTARILDVNYHMMIEESPHAIRMRWDPLVAITGEQERFAAQCAQATPQRLRVPGIQRREPQFHRGVHCFSARKRAHHSRPSLP